jgi:lysophospholipase L1-like esterase
MPFCKEMKNILLYILLIGGINVCGWSQLPFQEDIDKFVKADSISMPPTGAVLFVGSSSIVQWENLEKDFPSHKVINRGFGGSSLKDVIQFKDKIIFPYKPAQVVIYCGENDIASGVPATEVFSRFKDLYSSIRAKLPKASIVFVSMKPSPSRIQFHSEVQKGNKLISDFLKMQKRTRYVDVFTPMLDGEGKPRAELFKSDRLHMNEQGYAIWKQKLEPILK